MSLTKGTVHLEIHFLELPKVTRTDIRQMRTLDKWMAFIGNKLSNEEMEEIAMSEAAINMAWDRIETFMRDAGRRRKYEQREKYEHDYVSDMNGSRREGLAEGLAKGRAEGRAEGRHDGIVHVAINMLRAGTPIPIVAQMAELPETVVRKMAKEHGIEMLQ